MPNKMKSLKEAVAEYGTQEKAARAFGVSQVTLNRWLNHHHDPTSRIAKRLKHRGIAV